MIRRLVSVSAILYVATGHVDGSFGVDAVSELVADASDARDQGRFEAAQDEEHLTIATFDNATGTTYTWHTFNDPVMGGASHSTYQLEGSAGHFTGTCAIVPNHNFPGFCKITTHGFDPKAPPPHFANASRFIGGALYLEVETATPEYEGFRVAFGAKGAKRPLGPHNHEGQVFKAGFKAPAKRATVKVPFSSFSIDWSVFTGRCDTKDPTDGYQHHCCSNEHPEVCVTAEYLAQINGLEIWAEGFEGDFDIRVFSVGAGPMESQEMSLMV